MSSQKHKLVCFVGRTGAGKDTIANIIATKYKLEMIKSYTTRPKRNGELETHIFISEDEFAQYNDSIVAYTEINGYKYFCTQQQLNNADIYIIDPNGIKYLKEKCPEINFIVIYLHIDEKTRRDRVVNVRQDNPEVFKSRNKSEDIQFKEFEDTKAYDYWVENCELDKTIKEVIKILIKEGVATDESTHKF